MGTGKDRGGAMEGRMSLCRSRSVKRAGCVVAVTYSVRGRISYWVLVDGFKCVYVSVSEPIKYTIMQFHCKGTKRSVSRRRDSTF